MGRRRHQRILLIALMGLWGGLLLSHSGLAAPPLSKVGAQMAEAAGAAHGPQAIKLPGTRLDLAAPAATGFERASTAEFPATQHHLSAMAMEAFRAGPTSAASPLAGNSERIMSKPEALAHNFKREGLPVARLFQSENSLVHLGLSPKGKPGLWIIQKLH